MGLKNLKMKRWCWGVQTKTMDKTNATTSAEPTPKSSNSAAAAVGAGACSLNEIDAGKTPNRDEGHTSTEAVAERTRSQTKKTVSLDVDFGKLSLESTPSSADSKNVGKPTTPTRPNSARTRSHRLNFQSKLCWHCMCWYEMKLVLWYPIVRSPL